MTHHLDVLDIVKASLYAYTTPPDWFPDREELGKQLIRYQEAASSLKQHSAFIKAVLDKGVYRSDLAQHEETVFAPDEATVAAVVAACAAVGVRTHRSRAQLASSFASTIPTCSSGSSSRCFDALCSWASWFLRKAQ